MLRQLHPRLEAEGLAGEKDAAFQLGTTCGYPGQILVNAKRPDLAVEPSRRSISILERCWTILPKNLAVTLGNLATACEELGHFPRRRQRRSGGWQSTGSLAGSGTRP